MTNPDDNQGEGTEGQGEGEDQPPVLSYYMVKDAVLTAEDFTADDLSALVGALRVMAESEEDPQSEVQFEVKSAIASDDGTYADVVIVACDVEQTIRVPLYVAPSIRDDLQPLYALLSAEGEKSVKLTLSGRYKADANSEAKSFDVKAVLNIMEDNGYQFAVYSEGDQGQAGQQEQEVYAVYSGDKIALGNNAIDIMRLGALVDSFFAAIEEDADQEEEYIALVSTDDAIASDTEEEEELDVLTALFVDLSKDLNMLDWIGTTDEFDKIDDTYVMSLDVQYVIPLVLGKIEYKIESNIEEQIGKDIEMPSISDRVVALLDKQMDGALLDGSVKMVAMFTVLDDGIDVVVSVKNDRDNGDIGVHVVLTASAELETDLPTGENAVPKDLEITVPVVLPQKDFAATINAVVHISDMFAEGGKDYITATATLNDTQESLVRFNLNDYYVYLDITGLVNLYNEEAVSYTAFYYAPTAEDEEPISFFDAMLSGYSFRFNDEEDSDEDAGSEGSEYEIYDLSKLLSLLRFVDRDGDIRTRILNSIDNFESIIKNDANKETFDKVLQYESDENGFEMRLHVNNNDELWDVLNLFMGVHIIGDYYVDIDASRFQAIWKAICDEKDLIFSATKNYIIAELKERMPDLDVEAMSKDLYLRVRKSTEEDNSILITLSDNTGETVYYDLSLDVSESIEDDVSICLTLREREGQKVYFDYCLEMRKSTEDDTTVLTLRDRVGQKVYFNIGFGAKLVDPADPFLSTLTQEEIENANHNIDDLAKYVKPILEKLLGPIAEGDAGQDGDANQA